MLRAVQAILVGIVLVASFLFARMLLDANPPASVRTGWYENVYVATVVTTPLNPFDVDPVYKGVLRGSNTFQGWVLAGRVLGFSPERASFGAALSDVSMAKLPYDAHILSGPRPPQEVVSEILQVLQ